MNYKNIKLRKGKWDVPLGWSRIKEENSRILYRCPNISWSADKEWRRCTYKCRRNRIHLHQFHCYDLPQREDPDFPIQFLEEKNYQSQEKINRKIHMKIAKFSGEVNLSARKASSYSMTEFVSDFIKIGYELQNEKKL